MTGLFAGDFLWLWLAVGAAVVLAAVLKLRRRQRGGPSGPVDETSLDQLVGRRAVLSEDMRDGRGRLDIGGRICAVEGPDLCAGERVRLVAVRGDALVVERD